MATDIWSLVQANKFKEANYAAAKAYEETRNTFYLRNKVYALMHMQEYLESIILTKKIIIERNGESDTDFIFCGIAYWSIGHKSHAIEMWERGTHCKYSDAAGGIEIQIILYFASLKLRNEAIRKNSLKKIGRIINSKKSGLWPVPLGRFLLNEISINDLLDLVSVVNVLKERQLCQVHFLVAIHCLSNDDLLGYFEELKVCINFGPNSYLEQFFYLAKGELEIERRKI